MIAAQYTKSLALVRLLLKDKANINATSNVGVCERHSVGRQIYRECGWMACSGVFSYYGVTV